ncbi:conjugative transposon TraK protein [Pedobacter africanus]|uniref:conjugative transposon protein TraK n=1 Tax=Pedobacter africanus TaxID=151894 RepID=UPI0033960FCA
MFTQLKNIDRAFQHIKKFSIAFLIACVLLTSCVVYLCFSEIGKANNRVMILYNGKVLEAFAAERKQNIAVELRDHIRTFHQYFFALDPDEKAIAAGIGKALYLADNSAKQEWENLKEAGYYNNLIAANISQQLEVDSIRLDLNASPYRFTCYATQQLIRASSRVLRKLVTRGEIRVLQTQTDNNPHGFLIQHWETLVNQDTDANPSRP